MFGGKSLNFLTISENGLTVPGLNNQVVKGKEYLANVVLFHLLTYRGSNIFLPDLGSLLLGNIPTSDFDLWLAETIENIKTNIIQFQENNENLEPEERLEDIEIEEISVDENTGSLNIKLKVISQAGETFFVGT